MGDTHPHQSCDERIAALERDVKELRELTKFAYARLIYVYRESPNTDYQHKARAALKRGE